MSAIQIDVDAEVFAELQRQAEPLVDSANSVLRRLLELDGAAAEGATESARPNEDLVTSTRRQKKGRLRSRGRSRREGADRSDGKRAPKGVLLPSGEYELPILRTLVELNGRVPATEVLEALEPRLRDRLTPLDLEPISSGSVRWKNRAQFARLHLVRAGDMAKNSPRGLWEITEQGRRRVDAEPSPGVGL